jgi:hypothetical protein
LITTAATRDDQIARVADSLIDWNVVVDDQCRHVDAAVDALRVAVRERDRVQQYLAWLIESRNIWKGF